MRAPIALLLSLFASAVMADTPVAKIKGPSAASIGATVVLDARASVSDKPLRWRVEPEDAVLLTLDQSGREGVVAMLLDVRPGVYRFVLIARGTPPGAAELDADATVHTVTVGQPDPTPIPPNPPGPPPAPPSPTPPAPVAGPLHVSLVLDLDQITPEQARLREAPKARAYFDTAQTTYRTYAHDSPDAIRLNLVAKAEATGLPAVLIQDQTGKILWSGRAPPTEDELIAQVQAFRGAK